MEKTAKPAYRWLILVCLALYPFLALVPMMAPAAVLSDIMRDLDIGLSLSGLIMLIGTVMCGVCMFVGSWVENALGSRKALILGIWLLCAGNFVVFLAPSYAVLMVGRVLSGIGWGFCIACGNTLIYQWFEGKEQAYVITLINLVNPAAGALGYAIALPLSGALGGWKKMYLVFGIVAAAVAVFWTVFIKPRPEAVAALKAMREEAAQSGAGTRQPSPLAQAVRVKQYWVFLVFGTLLTFSTGAINSFLPTYLTQEVGLSGELAALISSITQITGAVGTLLSGALVAQTGRRKPFIQIGSAVFFACFLALTFTSGGVVIAALAGMALAFYYCVPNAQSVMIMELAPNTTIISGAFAMCYGAGQVFSVFNSALFEAVTRLTGSMGGALRIFACFALAAFLLATAFLRETGPHAKHS